MIVCKRIEYTGRVQGVGFRYQTYSLAQGFRVAGYVRNLPNGNVELVVEGSADQVDQLAETVARRMADYIADARVELEPQRGLRGFRIQH
jgi:acylphosphatase